MFLQLSHYTPQPQTSLREVISVLSHLQHTAATLLTSLLCTAVYNKPCLKYINLVHNNGNVHPEGDTGIIDFLFLECFFSWLLTELVLSLQAFVESEYVKDTSYS